MSAHHDTGRTAATTWPAGPDPNGSGGALLRVLAARVGALVEPWLSGPLPVPHRALQQTAEAAAYAWLAPGGLCGDPRLVPRAEECLDALARQQGRLGLFLTGDNVESPPDSSFTVNGLARLVRVCRDADRAELAGVRRRAEQVLRAVLPGLLTGGVHTPNHRWEIAAALAQLADLFDDQAAADRCDAWLAEGIDAQPDGLYTERSPSYAAHVTNPCLLLLARFRRLPALVDVVHRNLHAHLTLTDPTGRVETLQSRRQDQRLELSVAMFAWQLRVVALRTGCARCAAAAAWAEALGGSDPLAAIGAALTSPETLAPLPGHPAPAGSSPEAPGWEVLATSDVAVWRHGAARVVVRAAPDVAVLGRVESGTAANPTFAHVRVADAWVSSVRLSRSFFAVGPFRATTLTVDDTTARLTERVTASYYQPLGAAGAARAGGLDYAHEGRFAAQMSFAERVRDEVTLATTVTVTPHPDGAAFEVVTAGPRVTLTLELGLGDVAVEHVAGPWLDLGDGRVVASHGTVARLGSYDLALDVTGDLPAAVPAQVAYDPGEAYTFLGGTDAVGGARLYLAAATPGRLTARLRLVPTA